MHYNQFHTVRDIYICTLLYWLNSAFETSQTTYVGNSKASCIVHIHSLELCKLLKSYVVRLSVNDMTIDLAQDLYGMRIENCQARFSQPRVLNL